MDKVNKFKFITSLDVFSTVCVHLHFNFVLDMIMVLFLFGILQLLLWLLWAIITLQSRTAGLCCVESSCSINLAHNLYLSQHRAGGDSHEPLLYSCIRTTNREIAIHHISLCMKRPCIRYWDCSTRLYSTMSHAWSNMQINHIHCLPIVSALFISYLSYFARLGLLTVLLYCIIPYEWC